MTTATKTPHVEHNEARLFLHWTAGMTLPLAFVMLGIVPPLIGLTRSNDFTFAMN